MFGRAAVCIKVVSDFAKVVKEEKITDVEKIERRIEALCRKNTDKKEQRVCWYLGAMVRFAAVLLLARYHH